MSPPHIKPSVRVLAHQGSHAEGWRDALAEWTPAPSARLKTDGDAWVAQATLLGVPVVVKSRPIAGWWDRFRLAIGASREHRQWRGATMLRAAGIPAAAPLAIAVLAAPGEHPRACLVLERLAGPTLLRHLASPSLSPDQEAALARRVGAAAGRISRAGLVNRDAKPSNWIVTSTEPMTVSAIDTAGVRRDPRERAAHAMLASLVLEAIGTGCLPRRTQLWRGLRAYVGETATGSGRSGVKALWRAVARQIARHGDARPRVNPLA